MPRDLATSPIPLPSGQTAHGYVIRVRGHLGSMLQQEWFADLHIELLDNGETRLTTTITDQAYLFGVLLRLRDLGIALIAVEPALPPKPPD